MHKTLSFQGKTTARHTLSMIFLPDTWNRASLVRHREVRAGRVLVLAANEVRDLLVLGLLEGRLVVLRSLA